MVRNPVLYGVLALALAACGGGGGDSSPPPPPPLNSAPGAAAVNAFVQRSRFDLFHATDPSGNTWSFLTTLTPNGGTTTFNGTPNATSGTETNDLFKNGAAFAGNTNTGYHLINPYVPLGRAYTNGITKIVSNVSALPATVTVGQSGPLDTVTSYHDSTLGTLDATTVETFSVEALDATRLLLCVTAVTSNVTPQGTTDGFAAGTTSTCYTIDASGSMHIAKTMIN